MVIVKIFYLYHVILNSRSLTLYMAVKPLHDLHFQGHGVAPRHLFIDFRTPWPKKHRYRHQDYISSMFLAKDMKNNENSALGLFNFCAARGRGSGVHEKPNDKCAKMCRRYVGSAIWKRSVKKNPGKTYRGKTTGGCSNPLGCFRVNLDFCKSLFLKINSQQLN